MHNAPECTGDFTLSLKKSLKSPMRYMGNTSWVERHEKGYATSVFYIAGVADEGNIENHECQ